MAEVDKVVTPLAKMLRLVEWFIRAKWKVVEPTVTGPPASSVVRGGGFFTSGQGTWAGAGFQQGLTGGDGGTDGGFGGGGGMDDSGYHDKGGGGGGYSGGGGSNSERGGGGGSYNGSNLSINVAGVGDSNGTVV